MKESHLVPVEMKAPNQGFVIAKHVKHCRQSAHSHLQTKRPAGATNERSPKAPATSKTVLLKLHTKKEFLPLQNNIHIQDRTRRFSLAICTVKRQLRRIFFNPRPKNQMKYTNNYNTKRNSDKNSLLSQDALIKANAQLSAKNTDTNAPSTTLLIVLLSE